MSPETLLTKDCFLETMERIGRAADRQEKLLVSLENELIEYKGPLREIMLKLLEHDDLLEMIASEVSGTQNAITELHEQDHWSTKRIIGLERGFTKLLLRP